jgi:hypothetical protein
MGIVLLRKEATDDIPVVIQKRQDEKICQLRRKG